MVEGAEVARIFEGCWNDILKEYVRVPPVWCSEKDLQVRLVCELNKRLKEVNTDPEEQLLAYAELPVSLDPSEFEEQMSVGRPRRTRKSEVYTADVAIVGWHKPSDYSPYLYLVAELKYYPTTLISVAMLALAQGEFKGDVYRLLTFEGEATMRAIEKIKEWQRIGPSVSDINYFLGRGKGRSQVEKMIDIVRRYVEFDHDIYAYLCVVDDLYADLESILLEEVKQYNPPQRFKVLFKYIPINVERLELIISGSFNQS